MQQTYGVKQRNVTSSEIDKSVEEILVNGYTVITGVIFEQKLSHVRRLLDEFNDVQEKEWGKPGLSSIRENNIIRCPLVKSDVFLDIAVNERILQICEQLLGNYFILNQQNGVINKPQNLHHQSAWHRDLPYQDFVISRPLAISAFWCLDPFSPETGSTLVLPFSHKLDCMPSIEYVEKNAIQITANPGDVLVFDSMLYHRSGTNTSTIIRRGLNNIYSTPILKQQIDLPKALCGRHAENDFFARFLGYTSVVPDSVDDYLRKRVLKQKQSDQN